MNPRLLLSALALSSCLSAGPVLFGNHLPERVGTPGDPESRGLIFQTDREWLWDFDAEHPLEGLVAKGGSVSVSGDWAMSGSSSLRWEGAEGDALEFPVGMDLQGSAKGFAYGAFRHVSIGFLLESYDETKPAASVKVELLGKDGTVYETTAYLHKAGWNILDAIPTLPNKTRVKSLRLVRGPGASAPLFLDNAMIFLCPKSSIGVGTKGVGLPKTFWEVPPAKGEASAEEKAAFATIADRMGLNAPGAGSIPDAKMKSLEKWHASWEVTRRGALANGKFPLYYYRAVPGDLKQDSSSYFMYGENAALCGTMKEAGLAYATTTDPAQKETLGRIVVDIARLAATFGGLPNAWYNGRGFVEGVWYARDVLEKEGLLEPLSRQIIMQYAVENMITREPIWENPPIPEGETFRPEMIDTWWKCSADDLNTGSRSTILALLLGPDRAEKSEKLRRLARWYSRVAFSYAPHVNDALKPDGSWFHHWGNRFDNYGWQGAIRGATDVLFWFSGTPFRIEKGAHERLVHMGEIRHRFTFPDGGYGTFDNFQMATIPPTQNSMKDGFGGHYGHAITLNLARAGSPDGAEVPMRGFAAKYLALDGNAGFSSNAALVAEWKGRGIEAEGPVDDLVHLSYAAVQARRLGDSCFTVWGTSRWLYHTQYERAGTLFLAIGGTGLVNRARPHAAWAPGKEKDLSGRHDPKMERMTPGYHPSYAPGVTAVDADWKDLGQRYYQNGSGVFVGGTTLGKRLGVFVQDFDASGNPGKYSNGVASDLAFRKAWFTFDRRVVALGRGIRAGKEAPFTGVLQERADSGPGIRLAGDDESWSAAKEGLSSDRLSWAEAADGSLGAWFFPGQSVHGATGRLEAGGRSGPMSRLWLKHPSDGAGSYRFVYLLEPGTGATETFDRAMKGERPPIRILHDADDLQVVRDEEKKATGLVFWKAARVDEPGAVKGADAPCVVLTEDAEAGGGLRLSVADPDLRMDRTDANPLGASLPATVRLTLAGAWRLAEVKKVTGVDPAKVTTTPGPGGATILEATLKDGLSAEVLLVPVK